VYTDIKPPLGLDYEPAWLHGSDTKPKAATELVSKHAIGAFLVRLKKKGSAMVYLISVNVGSATTSKCANVEVQVENGNIVLDAKAGYLSGRLTSKVKELKTLAEAIDYLSNTPFDAEGRGWKLNLTTGVERDGTPIQAKWKAGSGDGGSAGGGGGGGNAIIDLLTKAPPKVHSAPGPSHVKPPVTFKVVCDGPCCDLTSGLGLVGDTWECKLKPKRVPKVRFGPTGDEEEELTLIERDKSAYSVHFLALKDYDGGANGFLRFSQGISVYVWNESGEPDADLGKLGPDGVYWMYGYIDEATHGLFPADHVGPGIPDTSLDAKLG